MAMWRDICNNNRGTRYAGYLYFTVANLCRPGSFLWILPNYPPSGNNIRRVKEYPPMCRSRERAQRLRLVCISGRYVGQVCGGNNSLCARYSGVGLEINPISLSSTYITYCRGGGPRWPPSPHYKNHPHPIKHISHIRKLRVAFLLRPRRQRRRPGMHYTLFFA